MPGVDRDFVQRVFLHYPQGHQLYVCIVDEKRRAFDFTDNTFKAGSKLAHVRDACLPATGHYEPRADHEYSYRVEIDLARLLQGTNPETIPADGAKVTVHWLRQVGDDPDVTVDARLTNSVILHNSGGQFRPANKWDADRLDEDREFAQRDAFAAEYRDFVLREIDTLDARQERLAAAVRSGNVAGVLRILAEDICNWAGNLKQHLLHQISHLAKDPSFVSSRMVPKDAPFQVYETWVVRDWIGCREAHDLLEFHKSADFARSFSSRLNRLHEARVEFCRNVIEYTVQTRGEDVDGVFVLDEARKELKHRAIWMAQYLDVIASQFEAGMSREAASAHPSRSDDDSVNQTANAANSERAATASVEASEKPAVEPAPDEVLRFALPIAVMSAAGLRDLLRIQYYYPNVIPENEAKSFHERFAANLKSAVEMCKLEQVFEISKIPTFESGGSDIELSVMMGVLAIWHPDINKGDSSAPDVAKWMDAAMTKCQEDVVEPVRSMIERILNAMLYDCRVPMPKDDPSFEEPQRFLQMLRAYWSIIRQLVLHHIEAPASYRPHPLMPLVLNLKARVEACFDRLLQLSGADDIRQQIVTLVEIVLSSEPDGLQAAPEWGYDQVASVDRFIEESRLVLGAKTYPLTPAEQVCLSHAEKEVQRYERQIQTHLSKTFARIDRKREANKNQAVSASPGEKTQSEPPPGAEQAGASETQPKLQQFVGGEIVFYEDRVEICRADVCSGTRSRSKRIVLELLGRRKDGKSFIAYSGEDLETEAKKLGAKGTAGGWIRDLRDDIYEALRTQVKMISSRRDVILSGGPGYRFAECLSVQFADKPAITDMNASEDVPNVRDDDVRDVFDVRDDAAAARRTWILQQLAEEVQLKVRTVAEHFVCAEKTAQRDLTALKDEGLIQYVGSTRTGYYRLCRTPPSGP